MDNEILISSARCDKYIMVGMYLDTIETEISQKITSLEQLNSLLCEFIKCQKEVYSAKAIKVGVAYVRSLYFEDVSFDYASNIFDCFINEKAKGNILSDEELKPLCDYMMHTAIKEATKHNLPIQIHTGMQDRNLNWLNDSHPLHLNNLFATYKDAIFDIFHVGYPFGREAGILAKSFPNVYVNFSWTHILSSKYSIDLMEEYFELIPANKFCGYGGDFMHVEGAYGHLQIAKVNIAKSLSNMVDNGYYSLEYAKCLAKQVLYDNPKKLYNL